MSSSCWPSVSTIRSGRSARARALLGTFDSPFTYGAHEFHLTASIGVSVGPDDGDLAERLIAHAEAASFDAKRMGRNVVRRYVPAMLATPSERHRLHRELLHAIERDQLELHYQPVYDVLSGPNDAASRRWCAGVIRRSA